MKNLYNYLFIIFTAICIFIMVLFTIKYKKISANQALLKDILSTYKEAINLNSYYSTLGLRLNDSTIFIDDNKKEASIREIFSAHSKLVLRLREEDCKSCFESEINALSSLGKEVGDSSIVLITSYTNIDDILRYKLIKNIPFKVYNMSSGSLFRNNSVEDLHVPYFFVLNNTEWATSIFIYNAAIKNFSSSYYSGIRDAFFKKTIHSLQNHK